ncbi:RNA polymerase sigma factor [Chryseobacterium oryctis]|uniref:RNA polymerase sigma factor n=1 Tax=Chryseobacterium oryctis TaxID=2952618 RepID=A0ABT3HIW4_9FLAO|nr:sigma-70 family RNA polymerase sigma factor [Chryseobacterium oryctis]MCW3159720.1 sigma-70 family RNA polymerase sigma factor [Chryseobacterium oryctis]
MSKLNWQKIYSDYSPKLLGICRRYIQDIYTAEDIIQESFITAIQKSNQLEDEKALFSWLKKIVVNNALQYLRKNNKDIFITTEPSELPDTFSEMEPTSLDSKKHILIYDFTREELLLSIDNLPTHHKSVFNLYFIENYSHAEISTALGISVNTSKSHLMRAKKFIQNYLLKNVVKPNTPKKKTSQLLVFFGFGGLLWAQTFQSKFSNFTISPSKTLEIPLDIKTSNVSFSNQILKNKIIIGATFLAIIIISIFLLSPKNSFFKRNNSTFSQDSVKENANNKTENKLEEQEKKSIINSKDSFINPNQTTDTNKNFPEIETLPEKDVLNTKKNSKKIILKDSIKEVPQKIIVVKKIIQRDTIFIEQ